MDLCYVVKSLQAIMRNSSRSRNILILKMSSLRSIGKKKKKSKNPKDRNWKNTDIFLMRPETIFSKAGFANIFSYICLDLITIRIEDSEIILTVPPT